MTNRCPYCHNQIPEWANGVCFVCVRGEQDAKKVGRKYKPVSLKYPKSKEAVKGKGKSIPSQLKSQSRKNKIKKVTYPKQKRVSSDKTRQRKKRPIPLKPYNSSDITGQMIKPDLLSPVNDRTRRLILNFNELFKDISGRERYFSYISTRKGIRYGQILSIQNNQRNLRIFLDNVLNSLREKISNTFGHEAYHVFKLFYGLEDLEKVGPDEIAIKLSKNLSYVLYLKKLVIKNLQSQTGSKVLDEIILSAYKQTKKVIDLK